MKHAPCKDCQERALHCHGACARYAAYKQAKEEASARQRAEMDAVDITIRGVERIAKARKGKRKGR